MRAAKPEVCISETENVSGGGGTICTASVAVTVALPPLTMSLMYAVAKSENKLSSAGAMAILESSPLTVLYASHGGTPSSGKNTRGGEPPTSADAITPVDASRVMTVASLSPPTKPRTISAVNASVAGRVCGCVSSMINVAVAVCAASDAICKIVTPPIVTSESGDGGSVKLNCAPAET